MGKRISLPNRTGPGRLLVWTALIIAGYGQGVCSDRPAGITGDSPKNPVVIGHRGAAGLAPENTMAAIEKALEIGVDGVEIDALTTADGEIVVHHDYRLKPAIARKPDGDWLAEWARLAIKDLTLAEIKTYDVGRLRPYAPYARRYPEQAPADGERIPTLREVISLLKKRMGETTQLWVEIKTSPKKPDLTPAPETVAGEVARILDEENMSARSLILSFDWRSLVHIQKIAPEIQTVYLTTTSPRSDTVQAGQPGRSPWTAGFDVDDFGGSIPRTVRAAGGRYWAARHNQITPEQVSESHRLGIRVVVWTVDSREDMVRLINFGVDGIITNRPDILNSVLRKNR